MCPAGSRCTQLQAGEGACASSSSWGYSCVPFDTSSCLSDSQCYSACPLGTRCTAVTPSLAGSWGVCDKVPLAYSTSVNGLVYTGSMGTSVFAMGFTCRACAPGDSCFTVNGCFDSQLCSSCPRNMLCGSVGAAPPCSAASVQAGRTYTCLNYTLAPGCYSTMSGSGNPYGCGNGCARGQQCQSATPQDCVRYPTLSTAAALDVAVNNYGSFYKCMAPTDCFSNAQCNNACYQQPGSVCSWVGGTSPCSAASPGYTCLAPGATPTAGCLYETCGTGCPAGSQCGTDYTGTCSSGIYAPSPPPPMPPAPPALMTAGTLYHGWMYNGNQDYNNYCNTTTYDSTEATASGGVFPYNAGDTIDCKSWKLAATICTSQPSSQPGNNWFCPTSGGFSDQAFGTFCSTNQQYVCTNCMNGNSGMPCNLPCTVYGVQQRTYITMVSCASREVFSNGITPVAAPSPPPIRARNSRCLATVPGSCFYDSSCLNSCASDSYCSYTQRCSSNYYSSGQYACFRFNTTGPRGQQYGACSLSYTNCSASCPAGSGCNYDTTCLSGNGNSPNGGSPVRCQAGAQSSPNPGYGGTPPSQVCVTQAACAATCQAPATCIRDTNAYSCNAPSYACHTPADCFPSGDCLQQCSGNQTCSYMDVTAPCNAAEPGFSCRNIEASCFSNEASCSGTCPAGTACTLDYSRRICTSNNTVGSGYNGNGYNGNGYNGNGYNGNGYGVSIVDVRGSYACLGASSCFSPADAASCQQVCDGTPCVPIASLKTACGAGSSPVPPPFINYGYALVCPTTRQLRQRGSAGPYILPLVTSLPLAGVMIITFVARALTAEQRRAVTRTLTSMFKGHADTAPMVRPSTVTAVLTVHMDDVGGMAPPPPAEIEPAAAAT